MFHMSLHIQKKYSIGLLCGVVVVLGGMFVYSHFVSASVPVFNLNSREGLAQAELFWNEEISRVGGEKAYMEFSRAYASSTPQYQHTAAHIFGGSLYTKVGVSGLSVCDDSFSYGCFHEFLARAIQEEGLGAVNMLNEGCFQALGPGKSLSCAHGLGHGIQSYLGYTDDALRKGLEICKTLPYADPIGGCPGGLFMEYNMRTMHSFSGMPIRSADVGGMQHPCDILKKEDRAVCYYWQPQWWIQLFKSQGKDVTDVFVEVGRLCGSIAENLHKQCFEGVGTVVGMSVKYDVPQTIALCDVVSVRENERSSCRVSAAGSFFGELSARKNAPLLCVGLVEPWYTTCGAVAVGKGEIPSTR